MTRPTPSDPFSRLTVDRDALLLWFLGISHALLSIGFQLAGAFSFAASGYANRVWAVLVIGVLLLDVWRTVLRRIPVLVVLALWGGWGLVLGNRPGDIVADVVLLFLPAVFFTYGRRVARRPPVRRHRFLRDYCILNAATVAIVSLPLFAAGYWMRPDMVFLGAVLTAALFRSHLRFWPFLLAGQFLVLLLVASKTYLAELAAAIVVIATRQRLPVLLAIVLFAIPALLAGSRLATVVGGQVAGKTAAFAESVQSAVGNRISTSDLFSDPFSYVDTSTAERVFELAGAVQLVSASGTTTLVGRGLGGALDLSGTRDRSVVMAHGGSDALESIRVVHLGITYALLKGGVCGLLAYLGFVVVAFVRAVRCMRAARTLWDSALVLCFIMYVSGSVFTFSNHFMAPALWVTWAVSGSLLNEATLLSRLRGPAGRRVPVPLRTAP